MARNYSVKLKSIINEFSLETAYLPDGAEETLISNVEVNRPGLQLGGYYEYYDNNRIQIIGRSEDSFLEKFEPDIYYQRVNDFFGTKPIAVIITRDMIPSDVMLEAAKKYAVPILKTGDGTSDFMSALIAYLNLNLAPRIIRHGVLVEVYGEGVLILGESGVGKSETAIELVKRGHRLIADDAVELRKVSSKSIVGSSPENIRHFIELRGIGIINVRRIFGVGAVKLTAKVDLVINLEPWDASKVYDRMGLDEQNNDILGLKIPSLTIPVKPGRNLAVIIEVAAMNNRQKKLGYNAANELLKRLELGSASGNGDSERSDEDWNSYY